MPRARSMLPDAVLVARKRYIAVKRAHGICSQLACNRPVENGAAACVKCRARIAAGTKRWECKR